MTKKSLHNTPVNVKIRLAALWTSVMFCYVYGDYFELYAPDKVNELISGNGILDSPMKLLAASIVMAIPASMIAMTVLLKARISRMLNIIFGIIFTLMMLLIAFSSMVQWYEFYVFLAFTESILTAMIVIIAWQWPKEL